MGNDIRIVGQTEDASWIDGKPRKEVRVVFYVGEHGPFSERFPKEGFTAAGVDARLEEFAREIRR